MRFFAGLFTALFITAAAAFAQHVVPVKVTFGSGSSTELPLRLVNSLVIVEGTVNGKTGNFIFDTGAESTVVDSAFSAKAGLRQSGKTTGTGSSGTATAGVMKGARVELGGVSSSGITLYALDLSSFTPSFGFVIDGIIGNDIIGSVVAEIDYKNKVLRLIRPDTFAAPRSAEVVPLTIKRNLPFVRAEITPLGRKSIPALMEIDTGSTGAVLLNGPFVRKNDLIQTLRTRIDNKTGGVGGTGTSVVGRLSTIGLGQRSLKEPIVVLYTGTKGDNASSAYDGLIGGGIFRRFRMTVDLPGRRLFLEPGTGVDEPFDMDMSGLEILADGTDLKTFLVDEVRPNSAGAKAGIEEGDTITAIDGKAAADLGLEEIHRLMRQSGATYDVTLDRKGKAFHVRLTLTSVI